MAPEATNGQEKSGARQVLIVRRAAADTHSSWFYNGETVVQPRTQFGHRFDHRRGLGLAHPAGEFDEHNASGRMSTRVNQVAEIAVLGDQHASFAEGAFDYRLIACTDRTLGDRKNVVASIAQRPNHRPRTTLVGHQLHCLQDFGATSESPSSTISSCATLAAP